MNFNLTEEQTMIRDMIRKFAEKELTSKAAEIDKSTEFSWDSLKKMAKMDLLGMNTPSKYDGAELDSISYAIVIEEISRACASTGVIVAVHNILAQYPIIQYGSEEIKKEISPCYGPRREDRCFCPY